MTPWVTQGEGPFREFIVEICGMTFSGLPRDGHTHMLRALWRDLMLPSVRLAFAVEKANSLTATTSRQESGCQDPDDGQGWYKPVHRRGWALSEAFQDEINIRCCGDGSPILLRERGKIAFPASWPVRTNFGQTKHTTKGVGCVGKQRRQASRRHGWSLYNCILVIVFDGSG